MTPWTTEELDRIGNADELQIASLRRDGTLRKPVIIWVARVGDELFVRSAYGRSAGWFRGIQLSREGHIRAGGVAKDVRFDDADAALHHQVDAAFRDKYRRHPAQYVNMVLTQEARSTTTRLVPRG